MSENRLVYSIQRTYILTHVVTPEREIVTCDQRIDIPTIEPLPNVQPVSLDEENLTVIPCIELAGAFLSEFNLTFKTNEGVTVLPIKIASGQADPLNNPYTHFRYVLALPSGAMGVKSCKLIHKATGKEVQHNFTFGIMPPPYNYDNALFGDLTAGLVQTVSMVTEFLGYIGEIVNHVAQLKLTSVVNHIDSKDLFKNQGEQKIEIDPHMLYFTTVFSYDQSSEETVHHPVIKIDGQPYTLSLNKPSQYVEVDLLMGMITVSDTVTNEIMQQFKVLFSRQDFNQISFKNFDDINGSILFVNVYGRPVG